METIPQLDTLFQNQEWVILCKVVVQRVLIDFSNTTGNGKSIGCFLYGNGKELLLKVKFTYVFKFGKIQLNSS